ncbi:MAG: Signal transduction histidine kinase regulating citrate/malate metabolism [Desulfotomaculum sp. 46_296]|nr:MAG: Signal transduction histidine kinase regulating citrate/malate metabolism [Desulfotomaculum sp. 46_296]KUK84422.1 MAG: Signal transduction histidine kinase regulating citrate/malate metabolism [Desulfofundulus kuznetsovii]
MDTDMFLEILRVQRHDFINHIQVISGFIQLNKIEQAKKYINEAVMQINRFGEIINLKPPEVAAALLEARNQAAKYGVEIDLRIEGSPESCLAPGKDLGSGLREIFSKALSGFLPEVENRNLKVSFMEEPGKFICRLGFSISAFREGLNESVEAVNRSMSAWGGNVVLTETENLCEVSFCLPKKETG